jgi:hypothetical protein
MTQLSKNARVAGLVYLASWVGVVRLMYIPQKLFVHANAAATAGNIAAHEQLFRWGIVCSLVGSAIWLFVPLALYRLLKGVDQGMAMVMVILGGLMQVPLFFINSVTDAAALLLVHGGDFLATFDKPQREALAMFFLQLHHHIDLANGIFWGLWLLPLGLLVYKSGFLPRFIGVWLIAGCFGWLAFSLAGLLRPGYEDKIFSAIQPLALGEVALMVWLIIMGAKEQRKVVAA